MISHCEHPAAHNKAMPSCEQNAVGFVKEDNDDDHDDHDEDDDHDDDDFTMQMQNPRTHKP